MQSSRVFNINGTEGYFNTPNSHLQPEKSTQRPSTKSEEEEKNEPKRQTRGIVTILQDWADKTSVSGTPFINQSTHIAVKLIWGILLLAACILMGYHLYLLINTYFDYEIRTDVRLNYDNLAFPAVTICNANPIKKSLSIFAPFELQMLIGRLDPLQRQGVAWDPTYDQCHDDICTQKRKKRQAMGPEVQNGTINDNDAIFDSTITKVRNTSYLDDVKFLQTPDSNIALEKDFFETNFEDSWEATAPVSSLYELDQEFEYQYGMQNITIRSLMGHQLSDMLLQCSFAGRTCYPTNFTRLHSMTYGNCFTLQSPKFISRRSGPKSGLQLKLFLETDEYLPGLSNSKGLQVVIHDQGTKPFPDEEGLAVKSGTETVIGLRRTEITRLDEPHGKCTDVSNFKKKFGVKYTRKTCQKICTEENLRKNCGCYESRAEDINAMIDIAMNAGASNKSKLQPCRSITEKSCAVIFHYQFQPNDENCECFNPCRESVFQTTVSSREWPTPGLQSLLVDAVCKNMHIFCDVLKIKAQQPVLVDTLRYEFLRLVIYYEDLNYEQLTEREDYPLDQFASDLGGTIGLWIGLSLLSVFEIFHLIGELIIHIGSICLRRR